MRHEPTAGQSPTTFRLQRDRVFNYLLCVDFRISRARSRGLSICQLKELLEAVSVSVPLCECNRLTRFIGGRSSSSKEISSRSLDISSCFPHLCPSIESPPPTSTSSRQQSTKLKRLHLIVSFQELRLPPETKHTYTYNVCFHRLSRATGQLYFLPQSSSSKTSTTL